MTPTPNHPIHTSPSVTPPTALILGAAGGFGQAAAAAFAAAGWRVLAQVRRAEAPLPPQAEAVHVGLHDTPALLRAAAGARVVVHAVNPPYTAWATEMLPLARQGMDLAQRLGARFVLPGNVYAYGEQMPALLDEDTPERPSTEKGHLRAQLEAELRQRAAAGDLQATVLRAGDFYGGGPGSWMDRVIVKSLARGRLEYPGPLDRAHAWAYLPDLAQACVAVAALPSAPAFEALHFAGHHFTGAEWLALIESAADELGLRPRKGWRHASVPWPLLRLLGIGVPMLREVVRMRYLWQVPHALSDQRLRQRIGTLPQTPPQQAMRAALQRLGFGAADRPTPTPAAPALGPLQRQ